jgi:hypothetical protein
MDKTKQLIQKVIHSPKLLVLSILTLFSLIIIILTATTAGPKIQGPISTVPVISTSPTPIPTLGAIVKEEPFPTPSLSIKWTSKEVDIPASLEIFTINQPLISSKNADSIAQKLGFSSQEEQPEIDENFRVWQKGNVGLSTNFTDNELIFSSLNLLPPKNNNYAEDSYYLAADNYLQNIFGDKFTQTLSRQTITYHNSKSESVTTVPSADADIVRVSYYQNIGEYSLTTISETGAIITLLLDKNLGLNVLTVKDAYINITPVGEYKTIPLSELIDSANTTAVRIDISPYADVAADLVSAKTINFNQASVKVAYLAYKKQLIPVYLLEGTVKTSVTPEFPGLYVLSAIKP